MRALYNFDLTINADLQRIILHPAIPFLIGEIVQVTVRSTLSGSSGENFAGFNWNFRIQPILSTSPNFSSPIIYSQFPSLNIIPADINDDGTIDLIFPRWNAKVVKIKFPFAFVATQNYPGSPGYLGFSILDISTPSHPVEISRLDNVFYNSEWPGGLVISDEWAYRTLGETKVIELTDKLHPQVKRTVEGLLNVELLTPSDEKDVIIVDHSPGISVYRNDLLTGVHSSKPNLVKNFQISQNYPNPFNSFTLIEFTISRRQNVILDVFDIAGKRVKRLWNGVTYPGKSQVRFDGSELASGIYIYKLTIGNRVFTSKMVLLR